MKHMFYFSDVTPHLEAFSIHFDIKNMHISPRNRTRNLINIGSSFFCSYYVKFSFSESSTRVDLMIMRSWASCGNFKVNSDINNDTITVLRDNILR